MTPARHPDPCVALIKFRNGTIASEAFRNENEFIAFYGSNTAFSDSEPVDWATLCDAVTGNVVLQISYPE